MDFETTRLVNEALLGDREAFDRLVERFAAKIFYLVLSVVADYAAAEDLTQETFVQAYVMLPKLREPERFPAWLARIARNRALSHLRKKKARPDSLPLDDAAPPLASGPPEEGADAERKRRLLEALRELPEIQRRLVCYKYLERMSLEEIAFLEGTSEASVRNHLYRARKALRRMLEDD